MGHALQADQHKCSCSTYHKISLLVFTTPDTRGKVWSTEDLHPEEEHTSRKHLTSPDIQKSMGLDQLHL